MAFTELSEVLSCLHAGALQSVSQRADLVERLQGLQAVFLRLGATAPAAQLDLAAQLLRDSGDGDAVSECLIVVRRMLAPIEHAFRLDAPALAASVALASVVPTESGGYLKARLCVARDMLLGEMLLHFGIIDAEALESALVEQQRSRGRLGEILVRQGATTTEELQRALAYQARLRSGERTASAAPSAEMRAADARPSPALPRNERPPPRLRMTSSLLLGEILFMQGAISRENLTRGLAEQRRSGRLLGEVLLELGLVTRRKLEHALSFQGKTRRRSSARRAA